MAKSKFRRLAALALASLVGCAASMGAAAQSVKIGLIGSLTGPHSGWDLPASEGVHMAFSEINAAGGVTVVLWGYRDPVPPVTLRLSRYYIDERAQHYAARSSLVTRDAACLCPEGNC